MPWEQVTEAELRNVVSKLDDTGILGAKEWRRGHHNTWVNKQGWRYSIRKVRAHDGVLVYRQEVTFKKHDFGIEIPLHQVQFPEGCLSAPGVSLIARFAKKLLENMSRAVSSE